MRTKLAPVRHPVETPARGRSPIMASPKTGAFRSVLVPIDLSAGSDRVLARVGLLPLTEDARVNLLHVVPEALEGDERRRAQRDAQELLSAEAKHLRRELAPGVHVEPLVVVGTPAKQIAAQATSTKADLTVMGRGLGRPLREAFLGSTAERVIRQAQRPVLVVRLPARGPYERPALSLALDDAAPEAVRMMLRVLPRPFPTVQVIHAYDMPFQGFVYPSLSRAESEERKDALRVEATGELVRVLDDALLRAKVEADEGPGWRMYVRYGSTRSIVERALAKAKSDLLVLGTKGHAGATFALLGTVAGDLLRATKCDVLVVPPGTHRG